MSHRRRSVEEVLGELTLAEKAALTSGSSFWYTHPVDRLDVPRVMVADGPHGLRAQPGAGDHVGIGGSIPATCFPPAAGLASSWDPELLHEVGVALGREATAAGVAVILGPGINMKRSPLCGRNFEYFSEDPFLTGRLAAPLVAGIQSQGVGTCVKHFAANNQETDRLRVDVRVDERTLREIYLPAFEHVVTTARPWTVMCAYNKVNGASASEHAWLLTDLLRDEWGFDGLVVSDWGAVYDRVPALRAGLDLEMPPALGRSPEAVMAAVAAGTLPLETLDRAVRRVVTLVERTRSAPADDLAVDLDAHHRLARRAASQALVLLKNQDALLPLDVSTRLGVIGALAHTPRYQGAGSSQVNPTRLETPLAELSATFASIRYAAGYRIDATSTDAALLAEAVEVAADMDVVALFLGLPPAAESEGFDRTHLDLPAQQIAVLAAVAEVNPAVVVVLSNGAVVTLGEVAPHAQALVEAWLGGQAGGGAITDVISGAVNPSGRLAETIPHRLEDAPSTLNFPGDSHVVRYGEGLFIGYRGYDRCDVEVAYPFGFGLSYTTFDYADLQVRLTGSVHEGTLAAAVTVTVTNTGPRDGSETVQVYVRDLATSVSRPVRELRGFAKPHLAAGESRTVTIRLDQRAFSFWSELWGRWVVEAGSFAIEVGRHSRDLPLTAVVEVEAPRIAAPLTRDSTLTEWWADPVGRRLIEAAGSWPATGAELLPVVGSMPMSTLANFDGMSLDHDALDAAVTAYRAGDPKAREKGC